MRLFSKRDIEIAKGYSKGKTFKKLSNEFGLSAGRCRDITGDVAHHVSSSLMGADAVGKFADIKILARYVRSGEFCDHVNIYMDRVTNRKIAASAPNLIRKGRYASGDDYLIGGVEYTWWQVFMVMLYDQDANGTWTIPQADNDASLNT